MADDSDYESLLGSSFRFVSLRRRSRQEISLYLNRRAKIKHISGETVSKVMDRLVELGYADDAEFARWWIHARTSTKPKGANLIRMELIRKGVDKDIIDQEISGILEQPDGADMEFESAKKAIGRKLELYRKLPRDKFKTKVYQFLLRRGFKSQTIARIIDGIAGKDYNTSSEF